MSYNEKGPLLRRPLGTLIQVSLGVYERGFS